jgi:hypothetical protein
LKTEPGLNLHHPRLIREEKTIRVMIQLYCAHHHEPEQGLCANCDELLKYARARLEMCPFGAEKSTCANCTIHCYKSDMRSMVREVMRYAGPRMTLRHPILSLLHLLDGRRPAPVLAKRRPGRRSPED